MIDLSLADPVLVFIYQFDDYDLFTPTFCLNEFFFYFKGTRANVRCVGHMTVTVSNY